MLRWVRKKLPEVRRAIFPYIPYRHGFEKAVRRHALAQLRKTANRFELPAVDFTIAFGDLCMGKARRNHEARRRQRKQYRGACRPRGLARIVSEDFRSL